MPQKKQSNLSYKNIFLETGKPVPRSLLKRARVFIIETKNLSSIKKILGEASVKFGARVFQTTVQNLQRTLQGISLVSHEPA